jgi:integrase
MGNNGGTAFVRINGKRIYLGKYGSPEAKQNYARCVAEWATTNTAEPGQPNPAIGSITVDSLSIAFLDHIQKNGFTHYHGCRSAVKILLQLYSGTTVDSFTPKCLAAVQFQFTQHVDKNGKRYCRRYCNDLVKYLRSMFRWGVAQELVSPITADALKYVSPLQRGRTDAPESKPREDVPNDVVDATLSHLLPTVAAMVQVQRWAVMRPNEVCRMRVCDIDMSRKDGIWLYCPPDHKGAWRGHGRIVPLGKPEQAIILPYLVGKSQEQLVFSSQTMILGQKASGAERWATNSKQRDREQYDAKTYAQAIKRAIIIANRSLPDDQKIPHWTPYQLRHAGVTELTFENDGNLDVARAVAGQRSLAVAQGYNHADLKIAIEQAKKRK